MAYQYNIEPGPGNDNNVAGVSNPIRNDATQQLPDSLPKANEPSIPASNGQMQIDLYKDIFTLSEILKIDFSSIPFLVQGLIPAECLSLIVGESDIGKSTLHTQLALSIITGAEKFLGRDINAKHNRVLLVSTEESICAIGNRIQKQIMKIHIPEGAGERLIIYTANDITPGKIKPILRKTPVDLIIVDAFSDVFRSDMNISNKVRPFFDNYQELIREFKCSVVFIHHIGKSRENMALHKNQVLGSVGIVDKARQVLWLSRGKKTSTERQLTIIKGNYVSDEEKNKSLILNFDAESRTFEYLEEKGIKNPNISHNESIDDETKQDIYDLIKAGTKREVIADTLGIHRVTLWRFLKKNPPPADNNKSKQIEEYLL